MKREQCSKAKMELVGDFINMEYARNITIIENAYKKIQEEKDMKKKTPQKEQMPFVKKMKKIKEGRN